MKPLSNDNSGFEDLGLEYIHRIDDLLMADSRERMFQEYIISPFLQRVLSEYEIVPVDTKVSGNAHDYSKYCGKYGAQGKDGNIHQYVETPDLCVSKGWKWINDSGNTDYIATVEIKTPLSDNCFWIAPGYEEKNEEKPIFENKVSDMVDFINKHMLSRDGNGYNYENDNSYCKDIKKQVGIHLRGINKVIVTDGIRWVFFYKDVNGVCHALDPIDLGKRICRRPRTRYKHICIEWDTEEYVIKGVRIPAGPRNFAKLEQQIREFCGKDVSQLKS